MDVLRFKQANCKNCYKCVRFCPVKSIRVYQGHAQIISSDCILCGNCVSVCPQHAKEDISDVAQIQELIASGHQVVVSVDSSYIAYFDTPGFAGIAEPLKKLGFAAAHETAEGAYLVKKELEKLAAQPGDAPIITSGCSTIVLYVEKHLPEALPYLAPVLSPMQAHAVLLRKRYPGATIVYVSPCISKKEETTRFESVGADYDITFTELEDWMHEAGVAVNPMCRRMSRCSRAATRSRTAFCIPCRSIPGAIICSSTVWMTAFRRSRASSTVNCATVSLKSPPATATVSAALLSGRSTRTCSSRAAA